MHETKLEALRIWPIQRERLIVAYQGGVDSTVNEVLPASELRIRS